MRLVDYLRLGFAGVKAHKKRAFTVVIIVGLLFSVITAGTFILQGLENMVLETMLEPTKGKILVMSGVDAETCGENCDLKKEVSQINSNIEKYNGKVIPAEVSQTTDGMFYKLEEDVFVNAHSENNSNVTEVIVPLDTAAKLAEIEMPEQGAEIAKKLEVVEKVQSKTLQQIVTSKTGAKYHIAKILPSGVYASDLSFMNIEQGNNPLNLIFGQIRTGMSQNFITKSAEVKLEVGSNDGGQYSGFITMDDVKAEEMGIVFAEFENIEAAYDYYRDKVNYCSEKDRIFRMCSKEYKYQVMAAISDPLTTYENLQNIWLVFKVVSAALAVIALIIALSTYARLISKDLKIISLYHALGATKGQICIVYAVYLLMLSLMAVGFAILLGLGLAAILSAVNMESTKQVWSLAFGTQAGEIWLIGWNNLIWWVIGVMILAAIVAVIIGNGNFTSRELAKKIK